MDKVSLVKFLSKLDVIFDGESLGGNDDRPEGESDLRRGCDGRGLHGNQRDGEDVQR